MVQVLCNVFLPPDPVVLFLFSYLLILLIVMERFDPLDHECYRVRSKAEALELHLCLRNSMLLLCPSLLQLCGELEV